MNEPTRTHAEAQAIVDFVARVLFHIREGDGPMALAIQAELDALEKETGVKLTKAAAAAGLDE